MVDSLRPISLVRSLHSLPIERPLVRRAGTKKPRDFQARKVTSETSRSKIKTRNKTANAHPHRNARAVAARTQTKELPQPAKITKCTEVARSKSGKIDTTRSEPKKLSQPGKIKPTPRKMTTRHRNWNRTYTKVPENTEARKSNTPWIQHASLTSHKEHSI